MTVGLLAKLFGNGLDGKHLVFIVGYELPYLVNKEHDTLDIFMITEIVLDYLCEFFYGK